MLKRMIWWSSGFCAGLGSSFWVKRAVNRRIRRYVPQNVRAAVARTARTAGNNVRGAVAEGRAAMRQYETDAEARVNGESATQLRAVPD